MKRILLALAVISAFFAQPLSAVTDKEMEEARTITAQAYLRYANDASGYLDEIKASSISDLRPKLKKQEIENLKAFQAVATPRDYASWDKKKLVEYWSVTFFNSPGLSEKGRNGGAKSRVKRKIEAMTVSAPEAAKTDKETAEGIEAPTKSPADIADAPDEAIVAGADSVKAIADSLQQTRKQLDEAIAVEEAVKKGSSHTWIYIVILVILVGVVIWLVIFASNVMKRRGDDDDDDDDDDSARRQRRTLPQPSVPSAGSTEEAVAEETSALREKFAATLASKNEEIRTLTRQAEALRQDYESIQQDNLSLRGEIDRWRGEAERLKNELAAAQQAASRQAATTRPAVAEEPRRQESQRPTQPLPAADGIRTIYLGRANNRSIFVRADRNLNVGHTLFRLDTADGFAGTFRVANDPTVWEMALMTPVESLAGACICADFNATDGATRITTISPGTAIFDGGCWKVIRKAKIAYE